MLVEVSGDHVEAMGRQALSWAASGATLDSDPGTLDLLDRAHISLVSDPDRPPTLFHVGSMSPAAAVFGDDWVAGALGSAGIPDTQAEARCNAAYYTAIRTGQPQFHVIRDVFQGVRETELFYVRTLVPFRTKAGARLVLCAADLIQASN